MPVAISTHPGTHKERKIMMTNNDSIVAIYPSHTAAEAAVKELQQSGFDMKKLSIVGLDYHTDISLTAPIGKQWSTIRKAVRNW
jgi:hypothetical protein